MFGGKRTKRTKLEMGGDTDILLPTIMRSEHGNPCQLVKLCFYSLFWSKMDLPQNIAKLQVTHEKSAVKLQRYNFYLLILFLLVIHTLLILWEFPECI